MSKTKTKQKMNRAAYKEHCWGLVLYFHGMSNCICINCKYDKMEWYEQHVR